MTRSIFFAMVLVWAVSLNARAQGVGPVAVVPGAGMEFWTGRPRCGANSMNASPPSSAYFKEARRQGIQWIRLAYDKWKPARRDFLLGDASRYEGLVAADLKTLKATLDRAHAEGIKVVVVPLSLPGMRWSQNNGARFDGRIWRDKERWRQSARFWGDLARELKGHPAVAAYNLVNEPAPEREGGVAEDASPEALKAWYSTVKGSARDLPAFYRLVLAAVRRVDPDTPVMLDAGWYARATGFTYWPDPVGDQKTLYAFHMYEPYPWSNPGNFRRAKPWVYPGPVPSASGGEQGWDRAAIARFLQPAYDWAKEQGIPAHRVVAGEFGCHRLSPGCATYLEDVLSVVEGHGSHWAFYAFREDTYDGFDYELGTWKAPWAYWRAQEKGRPWKLERTATSLYEPIARRLKAARERP